MLPRGRCVTGRGPDGSRRRDWTARLVPRHFHLSQRVCGSRDIVRRDGRRVAVGFAAAFDLQAAAKAAFLEMIQTELAFDAHEMRLAMNSDMPMSSADRRVAAWLQQAGLGTMGFLTGSDLRSGTQTGQAGTLSCLMEEINTASGGNVWFADLRRPAFAVPVVKAICIGLAHFKPRPGCDRLWTLPEQRGWQATYGRSDFERLMPLLV